MSPCRRHPTKPRKDPRVKKTEAAEAAEAARKAAEANPQLASKKNHSDSFLLRVYHYALNQFIATCSDTIKVGMQRLALVHLKNFQVANAALGEVTSPGHTIAASAGNAIAPAKNECRLAIDTLTLLLEAYKHHNGGFTPEDHASTNHAFVLMNMHLIPNNFEAFKTLTHEIGPQFLWHNENEKEHFLSLLNQYLPPTPGQNTPTQTPWVLMKQFESIYTYSLFISLLYTMPISLLIAFMPYLLNYLGNDLLMPVKYIALIFAFAPLTTVLTSMNHSLISIFDRYLQYRVTAAEILLRDIPQILCSLLGWHYQKPMIIVFGQLFPSLLTGITGSFIIGRELRRLPPQERQNLSPEQKTAIKKKIRKNVVSVLASAGFRMFTPFFFALLKEHVAILIYNLFYFLVWGFLGLPRSISQAYNNGRGEHKYGGHEKSLDGCLSWVNSAFTVTLALFFYGLQNYIIPFVTPPKNPMAEKADHFAHEWWLLGCIIFALLGPTYVQQDKIANAYEARYKLALINLIPSTIGLFLPAIFKLGGEAQIIGLLLGWLASEVIGITYGLCSPTFKGPLPRALTSATGSSTPRSPAAVPLLEDHHKQEPSTQDIEMADTPKLSLRTTASAFAPHTSGNGKTDVTPSQVNLAFAAPAAQHLARAGHRPTPIRTPGDTHGDAKPDAEFDLFS